MEPPKPFPEIGSSIDAAKVPWSDAVVWSEWVSNGQRVYEWLSKEHIRQVSWGTGTVSIQIHDRSYLYNTVKYLLIQSNLVSVGQNVPIG